MKSSSLLISLLFCLPCFSVATNWVLSADNSKEVKANGQVLKKASYWEFASMTQLETAKTEAYVYSDDKFYIISPDFGKMERRYHSADSR